MKTRIVLGLVVAVATTAGFHSAVEARVSPPIVDSVAAGCLALQNEADSLLAAVKRLLDDGEDPGEGAQVIRMRARLNEIGSQWAQICAGRFGSILPLTRGPAPIAVNPGQQILRR